MYSLCTPIQIFLEFRFYHDKPGTFLRTHCIAVMSDLVDKHFIVRYSDLIETPAVKCGLSYPGDFGEDVGSNFLIVVPSYKFQRLETGHIS